MTHHLDTVVALQRAFDELKDVERRLGGIPEWMAELHDEHSRSKAEIESLEAELATAVQRRRQAEGAMIDAQEKLKRYQQQINLVTTQREYGALLQEIDTVKAQISSLEDEALAALEQQERLEQELAERRQSFRELDERYAAELARWESEKPGVARLAEEIRQRIEVLKERLPKPFLAQFERIFERHHGEALAPILRVERAGRGPDVWHCGVCHYRVRPQVVVEIRNNGSLVPCDSCKRLLFLAEEPS